MVTDIASNFDFSPSYLSNIQTQISQAIAYITKKTNILQKLDIGKEYNPTDAITLSIYNDIIEQVKECSSCMCGQDLNNILHRAKELITKINGE